MAYATQAPHPQGGVNLDKKASRGAKGQAGQKPPKQPKQPRGKKAIPTKKSLNLYYKPETGRKSATAALYVLFGLVLLALVGKVAVYDLYVKKLDALAKVEGAQYRLNDINSRLLDYDEVKQKYIIFKATDEELDQLDRILILEAVQKVITGRAHVSSVSLTDDSTQLQLTGLTLAEASEIVREFEKSDIVADVTVSTAVKNEPGATSTDNNITATMTIDFAKPQPEPTPTMPTP